MGLRIFGKRYGGCEQGNRDFLLSSGLKNHREHRVHREKRHRSVLSVYSVVDQHCSDSFFQKPGPHRCDGNIGAGDFIFAMY